MNSEKTTYRTSHSKGGDGEHYQKTYETGYYAALWDDVEKTIIEEIFNQLKSRGASSCLDFACGTGRITGVAEDVFDEVVGVDISEEMLSVAKRALSKATLIEQDITKKLIKNSFDVISSFRFFLNAEPELRQSALHSLYQMLNDDGTLVLNIHVNKFSPLGRFYRLRNMVYGKTVANTLGWVQFEATLREAGFLITDTRWYGFYPRTGWMFGSLANSFLSPFERFCNNVRFLPRQWAQNFIVICRKI